LTSSVGSAGARVARASGRIGSAGAARLGSGWVFLGLMLVAISSAGCTKFENAMAAIPVFSMLRNSPFFDPYEAPRPAPPFSVPYSSPQGDVPGTILNSEAGLTAFGAATPNPLQPNDTLALRLGQVMFDRHCMVCHGAQGRGDGPILNKPGSPPGKFPFAPNLTLPISVARTDGYLYGIIAAGRGLMPAYGPRMKHVERWATVNYIRQLQRSAGAAPAAAPAPAQPAPGR
jgi:mono/diheme cytochrome c family protein